MYSMDRIKVVLIGNGGVGKTSLMTRLLEGRFERKYISTLGADVSPLVFSTNYGTIFFDVWDTAGQEKFGGLCEGYFIGSKAAIVMFEQSTSFGLKTIKQWTTSYSGVAPATPVAICRTKTDIAQPDFCSADVNKMRGKLKVPNTFCEISAKNEGNCTEPFLWIAREITGHADLVFI